MTTADTSSQIINSEVEVTSANIVNTGTDTQVLRVAHPDPAAARIKWLKLYANTSGTAAVQILIWDEDLTAGAISANSKQGANALATARFRVNIPANAFQVSLTQEQLPGLNFQAGIACRVSVADTFISVEYAKQLL